MSGRRGSFALEAALTVPALLVVLLFLISMLLSVQAEMRLKAAIDRTASEMALLPPVIFSLIDEGRYRLPVADLISGVLPGKGEAENASSGTGTQAAGSAAAVLSSLAPQLREGILDIIKPDRLDELVNDAALDLTSSVLLANLVNTRIRHWQERFGKNGLLSEPSAWLDWNLKDDQLFLEVDYEVRTLLGRNERQLTALVPVWRPQEPGPENAGSQSDSIWKLDNFTRGQKLRARFGGNLPSNYPVIARFENGEALSIKSMDLTRPTYTDPEAVQRSISAHLKDLAAFSGTAKPYGRNAVWIKDGDIETRRLLLVVPADSAFGRYQAVLAQLTREAEAQGIVFETVSFGKAKESSVASQPAPAKPAEARRAAGALAA